MSSSQTSIFTIGHSNHPWEKFAALLQNAEIETLADIRSFPRSRLAHFNRAQLCSRLEPLGVEYRFMGVDLGGRQPDGDASPDGWSIDQSRSIVDASGPGAQPNVSAAWV